MGTNSSKALDSNPKGLLERNLTYRSFRGYFISYTYDELKVLIEMSIDRFKTEPNSVEIGAPCVVVGDVLGQYSNLRKIFYLFFEDTTNGALTQQYVFMGNYVDLGRRSLECLVFLLTLQLQSPNKVVILRGSRETETMDNLNGLRIELADRFNKKESDFLYKGFLDLFAWMPLAALIGQRVLCVHGGVSRHLNSLEDIQNIPRPLNDVSWNALAMDLLWAAPKADMTGFSYNHGDEFVSYFGEDAVQACCQNLDVALIIRGNQSISGKVLILPTDGRVRLQTFQPEPLPMTEE